MKLTITKDCSDGKVVKLLCNQCGHSTRHDIVVGAREFRDDENPRYSIQYCTDHQVTMCRGCESFSYHQVSTNSEDFLHSNDPDDEGEYVETVAYFPPRATGRYVIRDVGLLPPGIQRLYTEAIAALNVGHLLLAGIGLRMIVEAICREQRADGDNLYKKIESLCDRKVLTEAGKEILHGIRDLGNDAAHEAEAREAEALNVAFDVVEHVLVGTYVLPAQAAGPLKRKPHGKRPDFLQAPAIA